VSQAAVDDVIIESDETRRQVSGGPVCDRRRVDWLSRRLRGRGLRARPRSGIGTGTGSDGSDAAVDGPIDGSGGGSDIDAAVDAPIDGSNGSDIDAAIDAPGPPIDAPGPPIDAPGPPIDAPGPPIDAPGGGSMQGPGDGGGTNDLRPLDRTSFYACAEGGCGSTTGAEVWLPLAIAIGFALRRPRPRRRTDRAAS
jgi:uncharacterized protein (TIGR03382 family)